MEVYYRAIKTSTPIARHLFIKECTSNQKGFLVEFMNGIQYMAELHSFAIFWASGGRVSTANAWSSATRLGRSVERQWMTVGGLQGLQCTDLRA